MFTIYDYFVIADTEVGDEESTRIKIQQERFSRNLYAAELRVKDGQPYLVAESSKTEFDGDTVQETLDTLKYIPQRSKDLYMVFPGGSVSEIGGHYIDVDKSNCDFLVFFPED
jgi:hypothetical protein